MNKYWAPRTTAIALSVILIVAVIVAQGMAADASDNLASDVPEGAAPSADSDSAEKPTDEETGQASEDDGAADPPGNGADDAERAPLLVELTQALRSLDRPVDDMVEWVRSAVKEYVPQDFAVHVRQADLDEDGQDEWVAVLREDVRFEPAGDVTGRRAYGVVIAYKDGEYRLDDVDFPEEVYGNAALEAIVDLTGDGKPEIVWSAHAIGAHTTLSTYTVSAWSSDGFDVWDSSAHMRNVSDLAIADGQLKLAGGLYGSVGAGAWQREYIDTYVVRDEALHWTDRVFESSPTPYHRLIDAMWAEAAGQTERALQTYADASQMEPGSYEGYAFVFDGEWVEAGVYPEREAAFEHAVRRIAELRKHYLTEALHGETPEAACASAKAAVSYDAAWLDALNAPAGYANPIWDAAAVCGSIETMEQ